MRELTEVFLEWRKSTQIFGQLKRLDECEHRFLDIRVTT
jgi:hypothetical protein